MKHFFYCALLILIIGNTYAQNGVEIRLDVLHDSVDILHPLYCKVTINNNLNSSITINNDDYKYIMNLNIKNFIDTSWKHSINFYNRLENSTIYAKNQISFENYICLFMIPWIGDETSQQYKFEVNVEFEGDNGQTFRRTSNAQMVSIDTKLDSANQGALNYLKSINQLSFFCPHTEINEYVYHYHHADSLALRACKYVVDSFPNSKLYPWAFYALLIQEIKKLSTAVNIANKSERLAAFDEARNMLLSTKDIDIENLKLLLTLQYSAYGRHFLKAFPNAYEELDSDTISRYFHFGRN